MKYQKQHHLENEKRINDDDVKYLENSVASKGFNVAVKIIEQAEYNMLTLKKMGMGSMKHKLLELF